MVELMQASNNWASRPADERFTNLETMAAVATDSKVRSRQFDVPAKALRMAPDADDKSGKGLKLITPNGSLADMSNIAFDQLSVIAGAPKGYLAKLPATIAADAMNFGLQEAGKEVGLYTMAHGTKGNITGLTG